uniref:Uncharacterized protein n=1 Tax=Octopus bimaculoides TaxID=37653 RepID=A0A0L8IH56_OCTBM
MQKTARFNCIPSAAITKLGPLKLLVPFLVATLVSAPAKAGIFSTTAERPNENATEYITVDCGRTVTLTSDRAETVVISCVNKSMSFKMDTRKYSSLLFHSPSLLLSVNLYV